jgi:hypothetical protein
MRLPLTRPLRWTLGLLLGFFLLWSFVLPQAAAPLLRWTFAKAEAQLGGHRLVFGEAHFSPWRLALAVDGLKLLEPKGGVLAELQQLRLNLDLLGSLRHRALSLDALGLDAPRLQLSLLREGTNWSPLLRALQPRNAEPESETGEPPRLRIALLQLAQGRIDYLDASQQPQRRSHIDPLQLELRELSTLAEERGAHQLVAHTGVGAVLRWRGEFGLQPLHAQGQLEGEGLDLARLWALLPRQPLAVLPPKGKAAFGLRYTLRAEPGKKADLQLDELRLQLDGLALQGPQSAEAALQLKTLRVEGGRLDLQRRELQIQALRLHDGRLQAALDAQGRLNLLDWLPTEPATAAMTQPAPRWQLQLAALDLQRLALRVDDAGFATPQRFEADALGLGFALQAGVGGEAPTALRLNGLRLQLEGLRAGDWLKLREARLEDGELDLGERRLELKAIHLGGAQLQLRRDTKGQLPLLAALQRRPRPSTASAAAPAWATQIGPLQLDNAGLQLLDEAVAGGARWQLDLPQTRLEGLGSKTLQLQSEASLASGGRLKAAGQLLPQADLRLKLDGLALAPLRPYLAPYTPLRLVDGRLSATGRLRLPPQSWSFEGSAGLRALRVDEAGGETFLAWQALDAPRLRLRPGDFDLGRLRLDGLQAKLLIDTQKRSNWSGLWTAPAEAKTEASTEAATRIRLASLRLAGAQIAFADQSLALPFAARIHQGDGELAGLDSAAGSAPAQLRFEGQVDEHGLARASGQLQPLAPTAFSDVKLLFRNVEMTSLTPYTATFAGRRIASGKLDLDLEYKLRDRMLAGDNRIVMQTLTLGEKVDSPSATSLPLDLAIALLEDSEGRIDLNLPVSGSLDEPQFSYGGLVWKVIVNVLTKIVSSPFRALGNLLGGDQQLAEHIDFDPGSAALLPPEREKLQQLAQVLVKRPGLALQLAAGFDAERDATALKDLQLRRALALLQGRPADEAPGLLQLGEVGTQDALKRLFAQRFGEAALQTLQQRHALAQPAPPPGLAQRLLAGAQQLAGRAPAPLSEVERAALQGRPLPELLWQRLFTAETLTPEALKQLGAARAAAMAAHLQAQGLNATRLRLADAAALAQPTADGPVALPLGATTMR